jgi:hypothetical protein
LNKDIFGQKVTYEYDKYSVAIKTIAVVTFNKDGKSVKSVDGFRIVTKTTDAGVTHQGQQLPLDVNGKIILPNGLNAFIQMIENFSRPETLWDKYWDFVLSPGDSKQWYEPVPLGNSNIGTSQIR